MRLTQTRTPTESRVLLWTLLIVYIFNFIDRQIVNILAEPIKNDLHLSDTQIGLMTGLAFALFYTLLGIPIARFADRPRSNRVTLIRVSLAIWSAMTALSGLAQNFVQLLLARIGVGVGEAGCTPAAMSLITDAVPKDRRARAIAFYGLGVPVGGMLGSILGGQLADAFGWRGAFYVVGIPGIVLAIALPFLIRESRNKSQPLATALQPAPALPTRAAFRIIWQSKAFPWIMFAASLTAFLGYGKGTWAAIYFIRSHGLSAGEAGLYLGAFLGIAGAIGTFGGGYLADRLARTDKRLTFLATAIGMAIGAPLLAWGYSHEDWRWAITLLFIPTACNLLYYGPTYACTQSLFPPDVRATATSLMLFAQNLIGLGLGPTVFGMLSDWLKPSVGDASVQAVLIWASWFALVPAALFLLASRFLEDELKSA